MMGSYVDFWELTSRALDATLEERGLTSETKVRNRLLSLYGELFADIVVEPSNFPIAITKSR